MEYLVTGGAGFIGSNMVRHLVEKNKKVRILDDLSTGRLDNIKDLLDKVDFIQGDLRDTDTVKHAVNDVRYIFHYGALPSVARSVEDPLTSNQTNVCGTLKLLLAARDARVDRFMYSSSSSVYGNTEVLPKTEDMVLMPLSPYAVQKLSGEYYCRIFHSLYGLKTFALRYFNVYGPRQNPKSQYSAVIPLFIDALKNRKPPVIHGDGEQTRDFTFVQDVINANLACCTAPDKACGQVFNIARCDRISVKGLASEIMNIMGIHITPIHESTRAGDVRDSQGDSRKAETLLGWRSDTNLQEGLQKTVDFYLARNNY